MSNFDREKYIWARLNEHYKEALSLGHEIFCVVLQGSQNYNLDINTDEYRSDIDTKAITLPSFDEFCKGYSPTSTTYVRENDEHIDLKDIRKMFETFKKQNVNFVEVLFSKYYIVPIKYQPYWRALQALGEELTHCFPSQTLKTMAGLSYEKKKALCHPYPTIKHKIDKWGYDGKQLHHILRINEFMKRYISGLPFSLCLTTRSPEIDQQMLDAKLNRFSLEEALEIAERVDNENCALKDSYIEKYGVACDASVYDKLDALKVDILRTWFKEQLNKE